MWYVFYRSQILLPNAQRQFTTKTVYREIGSISIHSAFAGKHTALKDAARSSRGENPPARKQEMPIGRKHRQRGKEYCDFYIIGFVNTLKVFGNSRKISHIFYPTSVYIDELPLNMGEYIVAKSAGEKYCDYLSAYRKGLKIYKPKLPRVSTDQTVSNFPIKNENPTDIMIRHLSIFNNM